MSRVAVIGAGFAGLACARSLAGAGLEVVVFEKSRGAGGRSPTRWLDRDCSPPVGFDHGAQYFQIHDPVFSELAEAAVKDGCLQPWEGRIVDLVYGEVSEHAAGDGPRMVGVPGMASFCKFLAGSLNLRTEVRIAEIKRAGDVWLLNAEGKLNASDLTAVGEFDWVVSAVPAEQAAVLLTPAHAEFGKLATSVISNMTWTVMLQTESRVDVDFDGGFVFDSPLGWICRDSSKPGRAAGERWVLHATADWSRAHENDPKEAIQEMLLDAFCSAVGHYLEPTYIQAHRWLYALPDNPLSNQFLFDASIGLGVCGDWLSDSRIEAACLSGLRLAAALTASEMEKA